jgi:eukaryotic-like serine/threonine-protein kinase
VKQSDSRNSELVLAPGTIVAGKYRVDRTLAEGGMGVVVAATHLHLQQSVALKFLRGGNVSSEWDALARFSGEAKAVAQLRSEHVAHVLDAGVTDDGTPYMVMEYLEGRSLARALQTQGPFDVASAAEYVIQACEGLAEAHSQGIVHRDIKPFNLFLVERSPGWHAIKIVDFGISKLAFSDTPNVTTGVIIGSPCYMSPEQLRSTATVDHRSDIWSLGATLHELLAGRAAFDATLTLPALVAAILDRPAPALREIRPDVPEALAAVVTRCLAKDREGRFQSAGELATALLPFAPARARVPAERAASMRPAVDQTRSATRLAAQPDPPAAKDRAATGQSLVPVTKPEFDDTPTPLPDTTELGAEGFRRRTPKWLGVATLGVAAALLFFAILVAATDDGGKSSSQAKSTERPVAAAALMRPEAPPLPTASLAPVEPNPPELIALLVRASPASAQIAIDGVPVTGNPFRASYPKGRGTHRVAVTADGYDSKSEDVSLGSDVVVDLNLARHGPAATTRSVAPSTQAHAARPNAARNLSSAGAPATQTPIASTGGDIESGGGHAPLRPIDIKDPYGVQ